MSAQFSPESFVDVNALDVYVNDFNTNNDAETYAKPERLGSIRQIRWAPLRFSVLMGRDAFAKQRLF